MPVVLCFESGKQLELAWQKSDDLSVSWNTIDLSAPSSAWIKPIEWRRDALPELQAVIGLAVVDVSATSSIFRTSPSEGPGVPTADWITDGIWFVLTNGGLHVYNGLDENALSLEPPPVDDDHASQLL